MHIGFLNIDFIDVVDVMLVAFLLYQIYRLIQGSIANKIFFGFIIVYVVYLLATAFGMELLSAILGQFMNVGVLALLIIFQQEIRRFLLMLGRSTSVQENAILKRFYTPKISKDKVSNLQAIVEATRTMAATHTGALIVIEKEDDLKKFIESGDEIDSQVSKRLLLTIFHKNSPLHDGAVIIKNSRLAAARCMLPISESGTISPTLGFRHRAAFGMSEQTDAAVIVVSEEKGEVSFVSHGGIFRNMSTKDLEAKLSEYLLN
ncbi:MULTISPECIES: diadenylate cyclase CdaA [Bacteroidota]|uniref:Diadenylate cyclase n=1 Tax=Flectobacillus rivi TaxID=2984209 RepID=A0ABT6Z3G3_9BACT|nr:MULTISPECIES: diadenylate cyclase CdaA [Bacteroidota]MDI9875655.1 diadenylate cyclase CdaA [Flectobacillus rivi]NBB30846.1 TIGR00159 family protein [Cellulophaga sp. BC115SP]